MKIPDRLIQHIRRARRRAALFYAAFLAVFAVSAVLLCLFFGEIAAQIGIFLFWLLLLWLFLRLKYVHRIGGEWRAPRIGFIREVSEKRQRIIPQWSVVARPHEAIVSCMALEWENGHFEKLVLDRFDTHLPFEVGDRVLWHPCFCVPLLLDRTPKENVCPVCGNVYITEATAHCRICGMTVTNIPEA